MEMPDRTEMEAVAVYVENLRSIQGVPGAR